MIFRRSDDLKIPIYDIDYFNEVTISPDDNCLYRSISYLLYGKEEQHMNIRILFINL